MRNLIWEEKSSKKEKSTSASPSAVVPNKPRRRRSRATRGIIPATLLDSISLVEGENPGGCWESEPAFCCRRRETRTTSVLLLRKGSAPTRRREERKYWYSGERVEGLALRVVPECAQKWKEFFWRVARRLWRFCTKKNLMFISVSETVRLRGHW